MAILIRPGKRFRKARAGNGAEILKKVGGLPKISQHRAG